MTIRLRALTEEERHVIDQMRRSRTEEARLVQRATIIAYASEGLKSEQIARLLLITGGSARKWIKRFHEQGLDGLLDAARSGAPARYAADERAQVIATSLTNPAELGLPFASWTTERLHSYLHEHCGLQMGKTRMFKLLQAEGLRWYQQEGWFGERVDPDFAKKRGRSNSSAVARQPAVPSSTSTRWYR